MRTIILVPLIAFVLLVAMLGSGLYSDPSRLPSALIDKPMPAFSAPTLHDPGRTLSRADILGRVALVNVWASWCVACLDEHPFLMALARSGKVPIYGLNYKDTREAALQWLAEHGNVYTAIAFDPDGAIGLDWGVYGVPETFIVDRHGLIRYKHIGPIDARALRETIEPWLKRLRNEPESPTSRAMENSLESNRHLERRHDL